MELLLLKEIGGTLVLLEAGHKVPGVFMHFPESIIRYISAKFSDYLISNGKDQLEQLSRWKVKGEIKEISTNTIHDSVLQTKIIESNKSNRVLVSIHRTENLNNKNNMELLVNTLCKISKNFSITWCLHIPTKNKLIRYGFYKKLKKEGIELINLLPYEIFVNNIFNSEFVITDGGGVVEECQIIGTPTLVWRNEHLDQNHIFQKGKNLKLSNYDKKTIEQFIMNYKELIQDTESKTKYNPSVEVVDILTKFNYLINFFKDKVRKPGIKENRTAIALSTIIKVITLATLNVSMLLEKNTKRSFKPSEAGVKEARLDKTEIEL